MLRVEGTSVSFPTVMVNCLPLVGQYTSLRSAKAVYQLIKNQNPPAYTTIISKELVLHSKCGLVSSLLTIALSITAIATKTFISLPIIACFYSLRMGYAFYGLNCNSQRMLEVLANPA